MKAYHVYWAKPRMAGYVAGGVSDDSTERHKNLSSIETVCLINSVLSFKKYFGGTVTLVCDTFTAEMYSKIGLLQLWDHVDTTTLDSMPKEIDGKTYFAAAKIYVQSKLTAPYVILDSDSYFVEKPTLDLNSFDLVIAHRESLAAADNDLLTYPNPKLFLKDSDTPYSKYQYKQYPLNVAFLYMNSEKLHKAYIADAMHFMLNHNDWKELGLANWAYQCFAEQRILGEVAAIQGSKIGYLSDLIFNGVSVSSIEAWKKNTPWINETTKEHVPFTYETEFIPPATIGSGFKHLWVDKQVLGLSKDLTKQIEQQLLKDMLSLLPQNVLSSTKYGNNHRIVSSFGTPGIVIPQQKKMIAV